MSNASDRQAFRFEGIGVHSGQRCRLTLHQIAISKTFRVTFSQNGKELPAIPKYIQTDSQRATTLSNGTMSVGTVEHLLFALFLFGNHWHIELDGPEVPILDGSANPYVRLLIRSGLETQSCFFDIPHATKISDGTSKAVILPCSPDESPRYTVQLVYPLPIGKMSFSIDPASPGKLQQIAPARTFALASEVQGLIARGLALGGSLDCALVIDSDGPLNSDGMRFPDEPARHKMLDFIGDMALLGELPRAHIHILRPGHRLNHLMVHQLSEFMSNK